MTLFQHIACEFPLLRDRFWPESAIVTASATGGRYCAVSNDGKSSTTQCYASLPHTAGGAGAARRNSTSSCQSSSGRCVSPGSAAAHAARQGSGDVDSLNAPDSQNTTAETRPRGPIGLRSLDLQALPRDDAGPPSELGARRQKFAQFEGHCSEVVPGLCVGGGAVARSRETLRAAGITHVVNCVGMLIPACFEPELQYLTLFMHDVPGEDLTSLLYTVFDFIEAARSSGGCVLVHCSQGVSRSAALVIGYLMWKLDQGYDEVYQAVKAIRGVANPNIGFTCQLLQWQKRRAAAEPPQPRVLRIAPASLNTPDILLAKPVTLSEGGGLDPRGVFVLLRRHHCFVWQGKDAMTELLQAGLAAADALRRYEGVAPSVVVKQGSESRDALDTLLQAGGDGSAPREHSEWDDDFQALSRHKAGEGPAGKLNEQPRGRTMPVPRMCLGSSTSLSAIGDTPRGSKTPRSARNSRTSPNARARKSQRSQFPSSPGRPSRPEQGCDTDSCSSGSSDNSSPGACSDSDTGSSDED